MQKAGGTPAFCTRLQGDRVMQVSVIIPAYNAARTLAETLDSVFAQSHPAAEVFVVNDGSSDATADVARGFAGVRLLGQANAGPGPALNAGIAAARGDVLAFLDADDLWTPGAMAAQLALLARDRAADAAVGDMEEFVCPSEPAESAARFLPRSRRTGWISGATSVRADSFRRVGGFGALGGGHWIDWMDRAKRAGLVFAGSGELVLRRRLHGSSLTMKEDARKGRSLLLAARAAILRRKEQQTDG